MTALLHVFAVYIDTPRLRQAANLNPEPQPCEAHTPYTLNPRPLNPQPSCILENFR